jgi:hypothetical protein
MAEVTLTADMSGGGKWRNIELFSHFYFLDSCLI